MGLSALARIRGAHVKITRPPTTRDADGTVRTIAGGEFVLYPDVTLHITPLTVERKAHVFGEKAQASWTARTPLEWTVQQHDQITVLDGVNAGARYRIEKRVDYTRRLHSQHAELALVALTPGAA